jgi:hypothetical protein
MPVSDTALGMILENKFTKLAILGSDGRLAVYEPTPDIEGIDRLVKLVGDFDPIGVQIKGTDKRTKIGEVRAKIGEVRAKIRLVTFTESRFNFVAILELDPMSFALGPFVWIIRTDELAKLATRWRGRLVFQASPDPESHDKYTPWRYRVGEVAGVVETAVRLLNERGHKAKLPTQRKEVEAHCRRLGIAWPAKKRRQRR